MFIVIWHKYWFSLVDEGKVPKLREGSLIHSPQSHGKSVCMNRILFHLDVRAFHPDEFVWTSRLIPINEKTHF